MSDTPERRAHPRIVTKLTVQGTPEDGGVVARMVASNLSLGGLQCVSTADFPEMTRLAVRLMLPARNGNKALEQPLDLEAVVVRCRELQSNSGEPRYELSLFFTQVDTGGREQLSKYLQRSG